MKTLLFIAAGLLVSTVMALPSAELTISGTVAAFDDIQIAPLAAATNLQIVSGQSGTKVADVAETSNRIAGYQIQLSSAKQGNLVHLSQTGPVAGVPVTMKTPYTVKYNTSGYVSLATAQLFPGQPSLTALTTKNSTVDVQVSSNAFAVEGTYQDVITISIVSN